MTDLWWTTLPKSSVGEVCPRLATAQEQAREVERERWRFASDDSWWFESPRLADMERTA